MRGTTLLRNGLLISVLSLLLSACATQSDFPGDESDQQTQMSEEDSRLPLYHGQAPFSSSFNESKYMSTMPQTTDLSTSKVIVVDPRRFAWGAYEGGKLVRAGIATAGADYCPDDHAPCHTKPGTYHIYSMGGADCVSRTYPRPVGGALMPYCMFFDGGQSLHGSPDPMLVEANISHGCVHMRIPDAEWLRNNFATIGTKVVVQPY